MRMVCNVPARATSDAPSNSDEAALIVRLREGDGSAFETLVRTYADRMYATALRMLSNEQDAQDAVQDAFLSVHRFLGGFEGASSLGTWTHRILINCCLMKLRARKRRRERSIEDLLPRFREDGHQEKPAIPWNLPVEDAIQRKDTRELVRKCIDRLPMAYRTVILLRDIEGLRTDEVATLLETTPNAVKIRLHRARQALRELLDPQLRGGDA